MNLIAFSVSVHWNALRHFMAGMPCHDFVTDFHFVKELLLRFRSNAIKSFVQAFLLAKLYGIDGGAKEDRTPDLLRARQALSQLSYGPSRNWRRETGDEVFLLSGGCASFAFRFPRHPLVSSFQKLVSSWWA